jgi:1-acyl-sn-glycerol-3-phosphate acyltransferase
MLRSTSNDLLYLPKDIPSVIQPGCSVALRMVLSVPFAGVYADLRAMQQLCGSPIVVVANHICVYDSWLARVVCDALKRPIWLAAAASLLDWVPPLRWFGLFAVRGGTPVATARQLRAIGELARGDKRRAVVFFPEGGHVRPGLKVPAQRGALAVARAAHAPIVPLALHYEFFERARPFAYLRAAEPVDVEHDTRVDLRAVLDDASNRLGRDLIEGTGSYSPLLRQRGRTQLVANVPLDRRRLSRSKGPLYSELGPYLRKTRLEDTHVQH